MDPFSAAGLGIEALGLSAKAVAWIKNTVSKKVLVTPPEITVTTKHWDSTSSIIIQNITDRPLFEVQIVCWFDGEQIIEFKPHHMEKPQVITGGITMDSALFILSGFVEDGRHLHVLTLRRLLPKESPEIDLQIKGRGTVKFFPASYSARGDKQILNDGNRVATPFEVPFSMKLSSIGTWLKRTAD